MKASTWTIARWHFSLLELAAIAVLVVAASLRSERDA